MKKEEENEFDLEFSQGVVHDAANPFVLAFRKNKDIAAFLDEREKVEQAVKKPVKPKSSVEVGQVNHTEGIPEAQGQHSSSDEGSVDLSSTVVETVDDDDITTREVTAGSSRAGNDEEPGSVESRLSQSVGVFETVEEAEASPKEVVIGSSSASNDEQPESIASTISQSVERVTETVEEAEATPNEDAVVSSNAGDDPELKGIESISSQSIDGALQIVEKEAEEAPSTDGVKDGTSDLSGEKVDQPGDAIAKDGVKIQTPTVQNEISSTETVGNEGRARNPNENGSITGSGGQASNPSLFYGPLNN